ncbi:hypothetical protein GFL51_13605 [Rhizobium leguminosarum bv. viciae]|nr:hypothetical protein [Rhizobium leguminosarum bv. viciae]
MRRLYRLILHNSPNRNRFKDKIMQQLKVLQRPLHHSKRRAALQTSKAFTRVKLRLKSTLRRPRTRGPRKPHAHGCDRRG